MISVDEARQRVLQGLEPLPSEEVLLDAAAGRVIARDVTAPCPLPPFDNSAMDGYALRSADTRAATQEALARLKVAGAVPAGRTFDGRIDAGEAVRIFTGAPLPDGADAVVMQEDVAIDAGGILLVKAPVRPGNHVRKAGEDIARGALAIPAGEAVTFGHVGLLAALGFGSVPVVQRPRVAILGTGDELVAVTDAPGPGQIRESNTHMLAVLAADFGGRLVSNELVPDRRDLVKDAIARALAVADVLIISGGVSVGEHDHTRQAMEDAGCRMEFWKVRMKPGKPLAFGRAGGRLVFGLPGNPASAAVTFLEFVAPALAVLGGGRHEVPIRTRARLLDDARHTPGRREFVRARITLSSEGLVAQPLALQSSGSLSSLAQASGFVVIPEDSTGLESGSLVDVELFGLGFHGPDPTRFRTPRRPL